MDMLTHLNLWQTGYSFPNTYSGANQFSVLKKHHYLAKEVAPHQLLQN